MIPLPMEQANNSKPRRLVAIDCDAGVDDAQALMCALVRHARPDGDIHLLAITCVAGNVGLDCVTKNVRRCCAVAVRAVQSAARRGAWPADGVEAAVARIRAVPVLRGAASPLIKELGESIDAAFWHGEDGAGGVGFQVDEALNLAGVEHASAAPGASLELLRLVQAHPGEVTLLCLGPLTNVALAAALDPEAFGNAVQQVIFMGGSRHGRGNITLSAEFNAYGDPEALHMCLRFLSRKIRMVGWDLTVRHGLPFDFVRETWLPLSSDPGESPARFFLSRISADIIAKSSGSAWAQRGFLIPDPLAVVVALQNQAVSREISCYGTVELGGRHCRGQVVLDLDRAVEVVQRSDGTSAEAKVAGGAEEQPTDYPGRDKPRNLRVVVELDLDTVKSVLLEGAAFVAV